MVHVGKLWRRDQPREDIGDRATVTSSIPLHGVGRVPLVTPHGVLTVGYDDQAKTFDYRLVSDDIEERWRHSFPMGSYAQSIYNTDTGEFCVPNSFTKYSALDPNDGRLLWDADLGSRIRSTAISLGDRYVIFIGNHILEFGPGGVTELAVLPGSIFFGKPAAHNGNLYSLAGVRRGDEASLAIVCFEPVSNEICWTSSIGRDYVVASDTAGPAVDDEHGLIVAGTHDGHAVAVDAGAGTIRWTAELSGRGTAVRSAPCIAEGVVAIGTLEGGLHLLRSSDGETIRSTMADPLGIWSTPAIHDGSVYVHAGAWLSKRKLSDLSADWEVPIGFNAYSAPVVGDSDQIFICGGDPPADGYLLSISLVDREAPMNIESEYIRGADHDFLQVTYVTGQHTDEIDLDLRHFGRTGHERMLRSGPGAYYWAGEVDQDKRYAEVAIFGRLYSGTNQRILSFVVDTGTMERPESAKVRALGDAELPAQAKSRANSGGPVLSAVLASQGKSVEPGLAEEAAQYMRGRGIDPHHIWRGGSARIIASSSLPLREMLDQETTRSDVIDVLEKWEGARDGA